MRIYISTLITILSQFLDSLLKTVGLFYFSKLANSRINPFENQMTLARPPMVLSTHTNDYVILRHCKIVVTKTARKKF